MCEPACSHDLLPMPRRFGARFGGVARGGDRTRRRVRVRYRTVTLGDTAQYVPLILYSPVSWLLLLRMLSADDALEPTVSTLSKPGCAESTSPAAVPGREFSSGESVAPVRRAKGLRIGILCGCRNRRKAPAQNSMFDRSATGLEQYAKDIMAKQSSRWAPRDGQPA